MSNSDNKTNQSSHFKIGISSCLLGHKVRYDGQHKWNSIVHESFPITFKWVPICPEYESGMGVPRPAIQIQHKEFTNKNTQLNLVEVNNPDHDHTQKMHSYIDSRLPTLIELSGYISKSSSPSCGINVPYFKDQTIITHGPGLFLKALLEKYPHIPLIDDIQLENVYIRNQFIEKVLQYEKKD